MDTCQQGPRFRSRKLNSTTLMRGGRKFECRIGFYLGIPQFLDYLRRRLRTYFIHSAEALERRMQNLDTRPDPDGRFRANMFFCLDDTWKMTVRPPSSGNRCDSDGPARLHAINPDGRRIERAL